MTSSRPRKKKYVDVRKRASNEHGKTYNALEMYVQVTYSISKFV